MRLLRGAVVGLLGLLAFEAVCRQVGWLDPTTRPDPYLGFPGTSPLYAAEIAPDGGTLLRTAPNKRGTTYNDQRFPMPKPDGEFRVFCIGGSSVRSEVFTNPDGTFPGLLGIELRGRLPGVTVRTINAGGGGQGSVQNLEVLREVLDDQPDLIVVYPEGGEKNVIPPSPQATLAIKDDASPARAAARRWLSRLRSYQLARITWQAAMPSAPEGGAAVSAFSALATFAVSRPFAAENFIKPFEMKLQSVPVLMEHPIPPAEIERAHGRFLRNLHTMAELCGERGVPLLFVQPVRNLEAVFYLRFHIAPEEIQSGRLIEWRLHYEKAVALRGQQRWSDALVELAAVRALYLDDHDELLAFLWGDCLVRLGRTQEALAEFEKPYLRHPMRELIARAGQRDGVPVVDPYPGVVAIAADGVPGYEEFTDSFHPLPRTNRAIATAIADAMATAGIGPAQRPPDAPERIKGAAYLDELVAGIPVPVPTRMVAALMRGDAAAAVAAGNTLSVPEILKMQPVTGVYMGWALSKAGELEAAREWHRRLGAVYGNPRNLPALATDEDIVRNAFGGDVFSWF